MRMVSENVCDRVDQLGRGKENSGMIVVRENAAAGAHHPVERLRDAHSQALHSPRKGLAAVRFHHEVEVVAEYREFDQAQAKPTQRRFEACLDDSEAAPAAEIPHAPRHSNRDVDRSRSVECRAWLVSTPSVVALMVCVRPRYGDHLPAATSMRD